MFLPLVDWTLANILGASFFLVIIIMAIWVTVIIMRAGKKKDKKDL